MKATVKNEGDKKQKKVNVLLIIVFVILVAYVLSILFVLCWGLMTSFKSAQEFLNRTQYIVNEMGELEFVRGEDGYPIRDPNILGLPDVFYSTWYFNQLIANGDWDFSSYHIFQNYEFVFYNFVKPVQSSSYYSSIWGDIEKAGYDATLLHYLLNSIIYAGGGAILYAFVTMLTGYLCAQYRFKFSAFLYTFLLIMMAIPIIGTSVSTVNLLKTLGIYDTYFAMLFMNANFGGIYFFVFYAYFRGLSSAYIEAAEIDGASQTGILFKIVVPLSAKMIGTIFLIQFISLWNAYEPIMLYYPSQPTLAYAVWWMNRSTEGTLPALQTQQTPQRIAGCMVLAIPILTLFLCFNKVVMGNVTVGGVKE